MFCYSFVTMLTYNKNKISYFIVLYKQKTLSNGHSCLVKTQDNRIGFVCENNLLSGVGKHVEYKKSLLPFVDK